MVSTDVQENTKATKNRHAIHQAHIYMKKKMSTIYTQKIYIRWRDLKFDVITYAPNSSSADNAYQELYPCKTQKSW